jgi:LysR family nitrogen assimilation transcriptional regulator
MMIAPDLEFRQLRYFAQVARSGGFSAAALVLDVAQPALSRQVRALEESLGVDLFHRTGRGVSLTHAGERLLERTDRILREVEEATEDLRALGAIASGSAVVGMPPTVGRVLTVPLMRGFRLAHPQIELRVVEGLSGDMADWLRTGRVDVAILFDSPRTPTVIADPVVEETLVVIGRPGSFETAEVRLTQLAGRALALPSPKHRLRRLVVEAAAQAGFVPDIALEIDSLHAMLEAARQGLGLTVVPLAAVLRDLAAGDLAAWPIVDPPLTRVLHVGTAAQRPRAIAAGKLAVLVRRQMLDMAAEARWRPVRDPATPLLGG